MRTFLLFTAFALIAACDEQVAPPAFDGVSSDARRSDATGPRRDLPYADGKVPCQVLAGPVTIATKPDLLKLEFARVVDGDILLSPTEGLWDQTVREVTGRVRVIGSSNAPVQAHITLAALGVIGGDLEVIHTQKGLLDLYRLETIGGSLVAQYGGWAFWTPALTTVAGGIDIRDASYLAVTFDNLATLGGVLRIERAAGLTTLSVPRLTKLKTTGEAVILRENPDLAALRFGALTTIEGDVRIEGNPKLVRATIDTALAGVVITGTTTICGNLDDEACP